MARAGILSGAFASVMLVVFGTLFGGGLAELTTRVYASTSGTSLARALRADPYDVLVEAHGDVGYRQKPNRTFEYGNGTAATSNDMGFRGPEVSVDKPDGTVRIVLLGGSTTHGWGVTDSETIDHYMRKLLAERYPGRVFEVINMGFDGYDSYQLFERLRSDGLRLDPDFVIVNTGINDVRNARFAGLQDRDPRTILWLPEVLRSLDEQSRGPSFWTKVKHHLYVARLPGAARKQLGAGPDTLTTPYPDALDYFERNLLRILDLTHNTRIITLFSVAPSSLRTKYAPDDRSDISYWIGDAATTQTYRDSLEGRLQSVVEHAMKEGYRAARVAPPVMDPKLFLDDAHLTPEGNRRVAEAFVESLGPFLADRN
jgi:lysophospholipase L1-like esterase